MLLEYPNTNNIHRIFPIRYFIMDLPNVKFVKNLKRQYAKKWNIIFRLQRKSTVEAHEITKQSHNKKKPFVQSDKFSKRETILSEHSDRNLTFFWHFQKPCSLLCFMTWKVLVNVLLCHFSNDHNFGTKNYLNNVKIQHCDLAKPYFLNREKNLVSHGLHHLSTAPYLEKKSTLRAISIQSLIFTSFQYEDYKKPWSPIQNKTEKTSNLLKPFDDSKNSDDSLTTLW